MYFWQNLPKTKRAAILHLMNGEVSFKVAVKNCCLLHYCCVSLHLTTVGFAKTSKKIASLTTHNIKKSVQFYFEFSDVKYFIFLLKKIGFAPRPDIMLSQTLMIYY